jgi:signal transduction histidine kinase
MPERDANPLPAEGRPSMRPSFLAGLRIRKKLIVLHTAFSLLLAGALAIALRPAISDVVNQAEAHERAVVLAMLLAERERAPTEPPSEQAARLERRLGNNVRLFVGTVDALGLEARAVDALDVESGPQLVATAAGRSMLVARDPDKSGVLLGASVMLESARAAVGRVYLLLTIALLAAYAFIAAALELFVLPQHVYRPLQRILDADTATREGRRDDELIPTSDIPRDELGAIMQSRNESIQSLRRHERALAGALEQVELAANDLKRKNHLLEAARRNLADADRLASLGMMSAGIAHELNTPLAVAKGLAEKLHAPGGDLSRAEAALLVRVVGRLERLSDSLLDFARVRPPRSRETELRATIDESWELVRLDRSAKSSSFVNHVPANLTAWCDADRIVQVLVNLLRNAVDASGSRPVTICARGETVERDGADWVSVQVLDDGPGLSPEVIDRLFQPFASTSLDSHGTGLGLAVAEGIVREHGGVILASNRSHEQGGLGGACFEIVLPRGAVAPATSGQGSSKAL